MSTWTPWLRQIVVGAALLVASAAVTAPAQLDQDTNGCTDLLVAQSTVAGHLVGENSCSITARSITTDNTGRTWDRVDIALGGTAAGYADPVTVGNTREDLTDVPNVLFPQFGITRWVSGVGTYAGGADGQGAGIDVLYPADRTQWTGKVVVLVHGQVNNSPLGHIVPQPVGAPLPATTFDNLYADEWMDAGYAVIYTRRPAASGVPTVLDDAGHTHLVESVNDNIHVLRDFLQTGEKLLTQKLGRTPSIVLWYGHSSGVIAGRLFNYSGLNDRSGGGHFVDGFLSDDPGGGLPLPLSMPMGQVLGASHGQATYPATALLSRAAMAQMVPEFTFAHALYLDQHTWLPGVTYLTLKQQAQVIYRQSGLANKTTLQVVAGVSHIPHSTGSPAHTLDMGPLMPAAIADLTAWVRNGTPPPAPTTGLPGDASLAQQVQLPSVACPTGTRYPWPFPGGAAGQTGWITYDGHSQEPVDARGALVDLNGDGVRDTLPSMRAVWRQRGLLGAHEPLTSAVYVSCVQRDVDSLEKQRLLTPATGAALLQDARRARI